MPYVAFCPFCGDNLKGGSDFVGEDEGYEIEEETEVDIDEGNGHDEPIH